MKKIVKSILGKIGIQTNRRIIIFTSDDWGSLRINSADDQLKLKKIGLNTTQNRFDAYDCLETNTDMEYLFEVLLKYKDHKGNNPIITAVTNVANPDFDKIRANNYETYFYEPVNETWNNHPKSDKVHQYYLEGIRHNIFVPESHGREHLQVNWWMEELKEKDSFARKCFSHKYFFIAPEFLKYPKPSGLGAAFNVLTENDIKEQSRIIRSGLEIFENLFSTKAQYFTPPSLIYNLALEEDLKNKSIKWIDVPLKQRIQVGTTKSKFRLNYLGKSNKHGIKYLTRTAVFETNIDHTDGVDRALADIESCFKLNMPAIISNHRASFVGGINNENQKRGLNSLNNLLKKLIQKWPDVEFSKISDLNTMKP